MTAQEYVNVVIPLDVTEASGFHLERPEGRSTEGWRVVNEDGFPVIYVGDRRLHTTPVSTEARSDGTVVAVRVQMDDL